METKRPDLAKEKLKDKDKDDPNKDESFKKAYGKFFIFLIIFVICFEYYYYVFEVSFKSFSQTKFIQHISQLIGFHFLLIMMLWCLITTMSTHPGEIPLYWVRLK